MAQIHVATSSPKAKELVDVVVAAIAEVSEYAANQSAVVWSTKHEAATYAIAEVVDHLRDHLQIDIAVTLATWGIE